MDKKRPKPFIAVLSNDGKVLKDGTLERYLIKVPVEPHSYFEFEGYEFMCYKQPQGRAAGQFCVVEVTSGCVTSQKRGAKSTYQENVSHPTAAEAIEETKYNVRGILSISDDRLDGYILRNIARFKKRAESIVIKLKILGLCK